MLYLITLLFVSPARQEVIDSVKLQRQRVDLSRGVQQSREVMDLLLLAVYSHVPPSRAKEIRSLTFYDETVNTSQPFDLKNFPNRNVLVAQEDGQYCMHFQSYKTAKYRGHDPVLVEVFKTQTFV